MLSTSRASPENEGEVIEESKENMDIGKVVKAKPREKALSVFEFELIISNDNKELLVQGRDIYSKRLFGEKFTHSSLIECGFHPKQTLAQICDIIEMAISGAKENVAELTIGFTSGSESTVRDEYRSGDKMCLGIEHNVSLFQMSYGILLREKKQSEVMILQEIIKDLRNENGQLREELTTIKAQIPKNDMIAEAKKLADEINGVASKLELQKKVVDDVQKNLEKFRTDSQAEMKEAVTKMEPLKKTVEENQKKIDKCQTDLQNVMKEKIAATKPEIAHWNSSTNSGNYRVWNVAVVNTTTDLFELQTSQRDVVLKKAGVYRIQANVNTYGQTSKYACIEINGANVSTGHSYTSQTTDYQHISLNHVARLAINAIIRVTSVGHYDNQTGNTLTVERLCE